MLSNNSKHHHLTAILFMVLACLTVACATAQAPSGDYRFHEDRPAAKADLTIKWTDPPGDRERQITQLTQCIDGRCGAVKLARLVISGRPGGGQQRSEVEVCQAVNPWKDRCDVYDCFEDNVGMMSVCNYLHSYSKSCYSETCSGS
jgi:hypothetical protein